MLFINENFSNSFHAVGRDNLQGWGKGGCRTGERGVGLGAGLGSNGFGFVLNTGGAGLDSWCAGVLAGGNYG